MKWGFLLTGLVIGAIGGAFGWVSWGIHNQVALSDQIIFPPKVFFDNHEEPFGAVVISGSLVLVNSAEVPEGDRPANPNNTYRIECNELHNECFVSYIEQIGHEQTGDIETFTIPVIKWDAKEIVAQDTPESWLCQQTTITISRVSKSLLWYEAPVNQTKPNCKNAGTSVRKFAIEDSPRWKDMDRSIKAASSR
jgi:hypothetical protein